MSQVGEWGTYEINHTEEFDTFNHEAHAPLAGRRYFIRQDQRKLMVGEINQLIKKQRHLQSSAHWEEQGPVHLVSSASTAGALRFGLNRPKKVISFLDPFSIGPVWQLDGKIGQDYRFEWLNENINFELEDYDLENNFTKTLLEIEDIPEYVPIYIWTANNGDEQTGLRFILNFLREKSNEIILINVTDQWSALQDKEQVMTHSAWLHPEQLCVLFNQNKTAKPLTNEERMQFLQEWELLAQSREVLRLWQNGRITSAPEDYFDAFILSIIEQLHHQQEFKDFIRTGKVIGEIMGELEELVSDSYFEYRIRHLVYTGVLELKGIPKSMRHYRVKLRD